MNTKSPLKTRRGWRQGAELAIAMLEQAEQCGTDECFELDSTNRNGAPQRNLVLEYFRRIRSLNDPRAEEAFCSMLTYYIGACAGGGIPDLETLDPYVRRPIETVTTLAGDAR